MENEPTDQSGEQPPEPVEVYPVKQVTPEMIEQLGRNSLAAVHRNGGYDKPDKRTSRSAWFS